MSINSRTVMIAVCLALLVAAFYVARAPKRENGEGNITARAEAYCAKQNVAEVFVSGDTIKVVGSLLGAGATYYRADGSELQCPVVAPDAMSSECKAVQAVEYWTEICNNADRPGGADPKNATYHIEGRSVTLVNGEAEEEAAPGSVMKTTTSIFGEPVRGDLDGDGRHDAALILVQGSGGTGTFYYAAAALAGPNGYRGTNTVLLGDRIAPQNVAVVHRVFVASYADRKPDEPLAAKPTVGVSKYMTLKNGELVGIAPLGVGEQVIAGNVIIGHEVRTFKPCGGEVFWIVGDSPALAAITDAYQKALPGATPYAPLMMTLAGSITGRPPDGFGADYEHGFRASQLVQVALGDQCE